MKAHQLSPDEVAKLLSQTEGHFIDMKAIEVSPAKLTRSISAFANADGGELLVGFDEANGSFSWRGFDDAEAANGHIQALEELFPLGAGFEYSFLTAANCKGIILRIEIAKAPDIRPGAQGKVYARRGAQNLPVSEEGLERLKKNKGITSYEIEPVNVDLTTITDSLQVIEFMVEVVPSSEPEPWLRKQQLIRGDHPTVAGLVLFADEPQAVLPKRCGIKLHRYNTSADEGSRETEAFQPMSVEGSAYSQITAAVSKTKEVIESTKVMTAEGLKSASYPEEALHEIITNAVLHRDYSIADDVHVRVFDNRVEIESPGVLPAHVTTDNILSERFARNGQIVRLINKFPEPPNRDIGEGLNTAFSAMEKMRLKPPEIVQREASVLVILRHESLGSPQELILEYLATNGTIRNKQARALCAINSENAMKHVLKRMVETGLLEVIEGETRFQTAYRLPSEADDDA